MAIKQYLEDPSRILLDLYEKTVNIHEYQAKQLLSSNIPVPDGHVVATAEEANTIFQQLGTWSVWC